MAQLTSLIHWYNISQIQTTTIKGAEKKNSNTKLKTKGYNIISQAKLDSSALENLEFQHDWNLN